MSPLSIARAFREGRITGPRGPLPARAALLTHRSLLLFTGNTVLKLARPGQPGGVDRSTRTLRLYGAERELFIGRQLSPHAYLADCGLAWTDDGFELVDDHAMSEPVVAMWRQPADRRLDHLAVAGALQPDDLRPVMEAVAAYHEGAPIERRHEGWGAPGRIAARWADAVASLDPQAPDAPVDAHALAALDAETRAWLDAAERHLAHRVTEGRRRDLHLALRLDHIYLTDPVTILDPDERPEGFHWSDTAEDVALLAVELDALGLASVASAAMDGYAGLTVDRTLRGVLPLFKRLVALRRAGDLWRDAAHEEGEAREETLGRARMYAELARAQGPTA